MISTALLAAAMSVVTLVVLAAAAFAFACRLENREDRVLVLLYHRLTADEEYACIEPPEERIYSIPVRRFRDHMNYLRTRGYHALSADTLLDYLEGRLRSIPRHSVLITFDDGCESVYSCALPILSEYGFPGLVFVTTDPEAQIFRAGNAAQRRVTDQEILALSKGALTIGSHAVTHRPLGAMKLQEIVSELDQSKRYLETVLGDSVRYFGVPFNWYGKRVRDAANRVGYRAVFTSDCGSVHGGSDPRHLRRITIEGSFSVEDLARSLSPSSIVQRRIVGGLKRLPSRLLGPRIWMPFRAALFRSPLGHLLPQRRFRWLAVAVFVVLVSLVGVAIYFAVG